MSATVVPTQRVAIRNDRVRLSDLLRSEWIKLTSVPAMVIGLASLVLISIGLPMATAAVAPSRGLLHHSVDQTVYGLVGFPATFTTLLAGILGVIAMGSEYSTRSIQTTLLTAPKRWMTLVAKALLMFGITAGLTLVSTFIAWAASYPLYASAGQQVGLDTPGVSLALVGGAFSVGVTAVVGIGVAVVVRSATMSAIILTGVTFGAMVVSLLLPAGLISGVVRTLVLGPVAYRMVEIRDETVFFDLSSGAMSVAATWVVLAAWAIITLTVGALVLKGRDA